MIHTLVQAVTHTTVQPVMPFTHTLVHITPCYRDALIRYQPVLLHGLSRGIHAKNAFM